MNLNVKNCQNDEHIPHKTRKYKGIHLTVEAEIMIINNAHPADFTKSARSLFWLIDIFVNYYDVEARRAFSTNARFLIKITSISQTA